ncbi:efflux RND transporter periplasmic adaptor subunit [Ideonella livida]|uniref:Efflux RND transporter periplasmic adaptor subunit n=1 Tax=Ideonella livida TaxID=2707176 RepID=A0A7C9PI59_9BURK|nr:efflux RND transporter periplasmic adaptor subunit [Ideonella livida]NDY91674.1 efflux RND transporter periplasmic adaptor subunit [Ideonella livida]
MNDPTSDSSSSRDAAGGLPDWLRTEGRPLWRRPVAWAAGLVLWGGVAALFGLGSEPPAAVRYLTEPVTQGDLAVTVTANGTLQPTRSVSIGSELSGTVSRVLVDVNDRVRQGQVLVELDTAKLGDQITQSQAAVTSAEASLQQAQASTLEARQSLARLQEVQRLSAGRLPAATELEAAQATLAKALAAEAVARAAVTQAQATLSTNRTNLAKASIRAPMDGVILTRNVEPGYAVAASLQAVTLFTLAADLRQLKLSVNVDEADVAQVQTGQTARFSVSAWPGRQYPATITRVAYGSTTTDNVVTYTTQLDVANADLSLRPGMTATALIAATEHRGVLLVPNAALGFTPATGTPAAAAQGGGVIDKLMPKPPGMGSGGKRSGTAAGAGRQVWVLRDGAPQAVPVTVGLSNGRQTEVRGEGLAPGVRVIVARQTGPAAPAAGSAP